MGHYNTAFNKNIFLLSFYYYYYNAPPMLSTPYRGGGGLSVPETLKAMPAVAQLLVEPARPDRSRGKSQSKRDTLVFQGGGWM
jgi:hypothetical protein